MGDLLKSFTNSPPAMIGLNLLVCVGIYGIAIHNEPLPQKLGIDLLPHIALLYLTVFAVLAMFFYWSDPEKSRKIIFYSSIPLYILIGCAIIYGRARRFG